MQDVCENVLWDLDYQNTCEVGGLEAFLYYKFEPQEIQRDL